VTAAEFHAAFEAAFAPGATAAGLQRARGKTPKWTGAAADGTTVTVAFRVNRKNMSGYPGEFMPDIVWDAPRYETRDTGHVSWYQYALASETAAVVALRRQILDSFLEGGAVAVRATEAGRTLVQLLADSRDAEIRPNQPPWLPYWHDEDAADWGHLFGRAIDGWLRRFAERPETLDAWCWRVLWKK
jgi:hypothetical protein